MLLLIQSYAAQCALSETEGIGLEDVAAFGSESDRAMAESTLLTLLQRTRGQPYPVFLPTVRFAYPEFVESLVRDLQAAGFEGLSLH